MSSMGLLKYGRLAEAWKGEASDFTPLLKERLDQLGSVIGVELASVGRSEVPTAGGRRIDIVAHAGDGSEFVIENQYGRADHDHLTRGLAYAVARGARGLVVVAEEHRDEFRTVAQYLNEVAATHDRERAVVVWLVEAKAVRVDDSAWAPLFTAVVEPNDFAYEVGRGQQREKLASADAFLAEFDSADGGSAAEQILKRWTQEHHRYRFGPNHAVLEAQGPSVNGFRSVISIYCDGSVSVPFSSYAGGNTGIAVNRLTSDEFRAKADALFNFSGSKRQASTLPKWLTTDRVDPLIDFCLDVASAYAEANNSGAADVAISTDGQDDSF